jgi:hypothetical protein
MPYRESLADLGDFVNDHTLIGGADQDYPEITSKGKKWIFLRVWIVSLYLNL